MNIFFLSGMLYDEREVLSNSKSNIQNAANVLQKKYLQGFKDNLYVRNVNIINLSYIGSYPKFYNKIIFNPCEKIINDSKCTVYDIGFFNLFFFKNISRFYKGFLKSIALLKKQDKTEETVFFIYAMHLPFLLIAFFLKIIFKDVVFYVIVPDLPEYMASRTGFSKILFSVFSKFSYFLVNRLDGVVTITEAMNKVFDDKLNKIVIEGISSADDFPEKTPNTLGKYFLYTGSLDKRYGLSDLLESFVAANLEDIDLIVCGAGKDEYLVKEFSQKYTSIKFYGLISRTEAIKLQQNAILLINPRKNEGDYVKYSFPSKTLEYMSSGTPVLMYKLSGIPDEYYTYSFVIDDKKHSFVKMLREIASYDVQYLDELGKLARKFVIEQKCSKVQVNKILQSVGKDFNV